MFRPSRNARKSGQRTTSLSQLRFSGITQPLKLVRYAALQLALSRAIYRSRTCVSSSYEIQKLFTAKCIIQ